MIFLAGVHDIGKATPVFQAKPISFGPDAESLAWKPEQAGLRMIVGLRDTSHPTHPIAGQVILERYFSLVHKWGGRESRQYACVVGGHHGTSPDKSKLESARLGKTESGLDSEVWKTTQNELIEFVAGTVGMGMKSGNCSLRRDSALSPLFLQQAWSLWPIGLPVTVMLICSP